MKFATRVTMILGAIFAVGIAIIVTGIYTDEEIRVRRMASYQQPPEAIWALISAYEQYPEWRSDVDLVDTGKDVGGNPTWVERHAGTTTTFIRVEATGDRRMVTRTYDSALPYSGEWIWTIGDRDNGSTLTITEKKRRQDPLDRFMAAYVRDAAAGVDTILVDVGEHFGEDVEPADAP